MLDPLLSDCRDDRPKGAELHCAFLRPFHIYTYFERSIFMASIILACAFVLLGFGSGFCAGVSYVTKKNNKSL